MRRILLALLLLLATHAGAQQCDSTEPTFTTDPRLGLQIPIIGKCNWGPPLQFSLTRLAGNTCFPGIACGITLGVDTQGQLPLLQGGTGINGTGMTTGSLFVGAGPQSVGVLSVGPDTVPLIADSGAPGGMRWGGAPVKLETPMVTGLAHFQNGNGAVARNNADSADYNLIGSTAGDGVRIGGTNAVDIELANTVSVESGVRNDGAGLKHKRTSTGSITGNTTATVDVVWTGSFADTNYTVACSVIDSTNNALALRILHVFPPTMSDVNVMVTNDNASPITGTVSCLGIHD